jgi:hypothetical protein
MQDYGDVAVSAAELARGGVRPPEAWAQAARNIFPHSQSSQDKSCPRGAFLGLCEEGRLAGVAAGPYTRSRDNKRYALRAVDLLVGDPTLAEGRPTALWAQVVGGHVKAHNSQMHVVLALWRRGLLSA